MQRTTIARAVTSFATVLLCALILLPLYGLANGLRFPFHNFLIGFASKETISALLIAATLIGLILYWNNVVRRFARVGIWRQYIVHLPKLLHPVPVLAAVTAFALFGFAGQMQEVYLIIVENDARLHFIIGLTIACALSAAIFSASLKLTRPYADALFGGASIPLRPALLISRQAAALLCGLAPLGGLLFGFWHSQDRLNQTISSAWAATRGVEDSGPLNIPAFHHRLVAGVLNLEWSVSFIVQALGLIGVLTVFFLVGQFFSWMLLGSPKGRMKIFWHSLLGAMLTTAFLILAFNLPGAFETGKQVHITDLVRASSFYTGAVLLVAFVMSLLLIWFRHATEAETMVWLICGALTLFALLVPPLVGAETLVDATRWLGPLAMAAAQFTTIFTIVLLLVHLSVRTGVPWILTLTVLIVVRAWMTSSSAPLKQIGDLPPAKIIVPQPTERPGEAQKGVDLAAWYDAKVRDERRRAYLAANKSRTVNKLPIKPFPVFVIAAQGGGIYAASAAAMFLANLEARCPGFSQHVYAISGVSGGSVGAAGFSALARATTVHSRATCLEVPSIETTRSAQGRSPNPSVLDDAAWIATQDHLSPVLALVAPEYAEKVFWLSARRMRSWFVNKPADLTRANALEKSLACAFHARPSTGTQHTCLSSKLDPELEAFGSHFDMSKGAPALVLNTTFVETGQRVAFSPFILSDLRDPHLTSFGELDPQLDKELQKVTLPEAAVASARFPGLMPAYSLELKRDRGEENAGTKGNWNFVDGGYSDNSGAATALAIVRKLNQQVKDAKLQNQVEVKLIILTSEVRNPDLSKVEGTTLVDSRAPIEALLNVRSTLAVREIDRAVAAPSSEWTMEKRQKEKVNEKEYTGWDVGVIRLDDKNFSLQLGWSLSRTTNHIISLFVTRPEYCAGNATTAGGSDPRIRQNACLIDDIITLLKP